MASITLGMRTDNSNPELYISLGHMSLIIQLLTIRMGNY
jgi:hypothetical protein